MATKLLLVVTVMTLRMNLKPLEDNYKVTIPRGTGRSYGIRWRSGMRVTGGTKVMDGQKDERTDGGWKGERTERRTDGKTGRIAQV